MGFVKSTWKKKNEIYLMIYIYINYIAKTIFKNMYIYIYKKVLNSKLEIKK